MSTSTRGLLRLRILLRPRGTRAQLVVALLCGLLGFALVTQVHNSTSATSRRTARPEDLVRILDDLSSRSDRLRAEIDTLRATRDRLASGQDSGSAALAETQRRATVLGILAGTIPASGPGITITVRDPQSTVRADALLGAVEELRDAGAEALQLSGGGGPAVRLVASTALLDAPGGGVLAGSTRLRPPYRLLAIGDPATLRAAMRIPGGVVDTVAASPGADATITVSNATSVAALQALPRPRYARPAGAS